MKVWVVNKVMDTGIRKMWKYLGLLKTIDVSIKNIHHGVSELKRLHLLVARVLRV